MVGSSGIVIAADNVKLDLSRTSSLPEIVAAGFDDSFIGVYIGEAHIKLPDGLPTLAPQDLKIDNCTIGSGGFSGALSPITPYSPVYSAVPELFRGPDRRKSLALPFGLTDVYLEIKANCIIAAKFGGQLKLPFFDVSSASMSASTKTARSPQPERFGSSGASGCQCP